MLKDVVDKEIDLDFIDPSLETEYYECISDIIDHDVVKSLIVYPQHGYSNRLQHSIYVSYYSFEVAKELELDYRSAARAGLLHDLFHYDWKNPDEAPEGNHAVAHPIAALRTAMEHFHLNDIEKDAIVKHMWPLALSRPLYKESTVVSLVDKYVATLEMYESSKIYLQEKLVKVKKFI